MITGLKLSAYDTRLDEPIDTYSFASNEEEGFTYSFSEAIYNPKALMVDAHRGVIGFPMSMYTYNEFESNYESSYVLFFIDFTNDQVISDPIFISQDEKSYDVQIDRAIFIEHIIDNVVTDRYIYTFSYEQIIVYHIESNTILEKVQLNEPINAYFD